MGGPLFVPFWLVTFADVIPPILLLFLPSSPSSPPPPSLSSLCLRSLSLCPPLPESRLRALTATVAVRGREDASLRRSHTAARLLILRSRPAITPLHRTPLLSSFPLCHPGLPSPLRSSPCPRLRGVGLHVRESSERGPISAGAPFKRHPSLPQFGVRPMHARPPRPLPRYSSLTGVSSSPLFSFTNVCLAGMAVGIPVAPLSNQICAHPSFAPAGINQPRLSAQLCYASRVLRSLIVPTSTRCKPLATRIVLPE